MALDARSAAGADLIRSESRGLFQCRACRRSSPIAGTIYASTHLPLRLWFRAMYHLTQSKQGISSEGPTPARVDAVSDAVKNLLDYYTAKECAN